MENKAESNKLADTPATSDHATENPEPNDDASQSNDEATSDDIGGTLSLFESAEPTPQDTANTAEVTGNDDDEVVDWDTFEEKHGPFNSREELRAARARFRQLEEQWSLSGRRAWNWKKVAIDSEKKQRALEKDLGDEKQRNEDLQERLDATLQEMNVLENKLVEATQELSLLAPESQAKTIKALESRITALEAENRALKNGSGEPQVQASGSSSEPAAIQQLDNNMGIDSDEEVDDFEGDDDDSDDKEEPAEDDAENEAEIDG